MKRFYTDYAVHCIRTCLSRSYEEIGTDIDRTNWIAARVVIQELSQTQQDIIRYVYFNVKGMEILRAESVRIASDHFKWTTDDIYELMARVERDVAIERKLIDDKFHTKRIKNIKAVGMPEGPGKGTDDGNGTDASQQH